MWDGTDAWILQSIAYSSRRGGLRSLLASADHINVAIPTRRELELAVNRLAAAELVEIKGSWVQATRAGRNLVRSSERRFEGVRSATPGSRRYFEMKPFPTVTGSGWTLSEVDWQEAYDAYQPPEERGENRADA